MAATNAGGGTPPAAELLCAFANTYDVDNGEEGPEKLPDAPALTAWLRARDLLQEPVSASEADLTLARDLRTGIRQAMIQHHEGDLAAPLPNLDRVAAQLPLRVAFEGTVPHLVPAATGVAGALARILVAVASAQADGSWPRLKLCAAQDCLWAFYDTSKNRSRQWCSMGVCGNRRKTRAYRARQRSVARRPGGGPGATTRPGSGSREA